MVARPCHARRRAGGGEALAWADAQRLRRRGATGKQAQQHRAGEARADQRPYTAFALPAKMPRFSSSLIAHLKA